MISVLLENLNDSFAEGQSLLGVGIEVAAKLGERFKLEILRIEKLQFARNLFHTLELSRTADSADGNTGVDSRHDTRMEKLCFKEYLTVRDRNNVGRNVSRNVACLRFNKRQCGD